MNASSEINYVDSGGKTGHLACACHRAHNKSSLLSTISNAKIPRKPQKRRFNGSVTVRNPGDYRLAQVSNFPEHFLLLIGKLSDLLYRAWGTRIRERNSNEKGNERDEETNRE